MAKLSALFVLVVSSWLVASQDRVDASVHTLQAVAADLIPGTVVLKNSNASMHAHVIPTGAIIQKLMVPDTSGDMVDVVLGYDILEPYLNGSSPYFGAVIGRVANRIAHAEFDLNSQVYYLSVNEGNNTLHGGKDGWSRRKWTFVEITPNSLVATLRSPNGDMGFPGNVNATVVYNVTDSNELLIDFRATSDEATPINIAQHSYFNLNGAMSGTTTLDNYVTINGSYYMPTDPEFIPTGEVEAVQGTPFDFLEPHAVGERIGQVTFPPPYGGYDHNYVLFGLSGSEAEAEADNTCVLPFGLQKAVTVESPQTGIKLEILTNAPGVQFYAGNQMKQDVPGKNRTVYPVHGAIVFETQVFPNFINTPDFPQCVVTPANPYRHQLVYHFSAAAESPRARVSGRRLAAF